MNIEVVEFYPSKKVKNMIIGTMHVYVIDLQFDIRGIYASIKINKDGKRFIYIDMPFLWGIDQDTKEKVRYPVLSFMDRDKNKEFSKAIKHKCIDYLLKIDLKTINL